LGQISIKINGYTYNAGCEDGQEAHLLAMAAEVEERIRGIKALGVQSGESFLLALAALMMADELHDMRTELEAARAAPKAAKPAKAAPDVSKRINKLAARAEAIADGLERA
jgi:cell division protein ZapA